MVDAKDTKGTGTFKDGALVGVATGASVASLITGALLVGVDAYSDPLRDAIREDKIANIQPDQLANDISKDPKLQARWREMREFVAKIDKGVQWNIAQDAKNLSHTAENWQERTDPPNLDTSKRPAR